MIDYHLHTPLCNHAEGELEAYIRQGIKLGLKEICFLDHLTISETGKNLSMPPEQVPFYLRAVRQAGEKYNGQIEVKAGLEVDFNPEHVGQVGDILAAHEFDMIGSSLHFFDEVDVVRHKGGWYRGEGNTDEVYTRYYDRIQEMLTYDYFDVICHFDLIKKPNRRPSASLDGPVNDILAAMKKKNIAMELNTSGYNHKTKEMYPSRRIIDKCVELGIGFTLGSDAHRPEEVGRHYDRALPLLKATGGRHLTVFNRRRPERIPIT